MQGRGFLHFRTKPQLSKMEFQDRCLKPLGHPSVFGCQRLSKAGRAAKGATAAHNAFPRGAACGSNFRNGLLMISLKAKFPSFVDDPGANHLASSQIGAYRNDDFSRLYSADRCGGRDHGFADHSFSWLLQLLCAASALRHLLSAAGRAAAIPHRRGNRDGSAGRDDRSPDAGAI